MPKQHFKYNTGSTITNTIQKGIHSIATEGTQDWGPTSVTGFYPETSPPTDGYTIYYMKPSGGPSVHVAYNNTQAINFLKSFGATGTTISDVLTWASNTANYYVQTGATSTYTIGQAALGGVIAYITGGGTTGTSGFVAQTSDIGSGANTFGCRNTNLATGDSIGSGFSNTTNWLAVCTTAGIAAKLCRDSTVGGYTDWYLPSRNELTELYNNRVAIGNFNTVTTPFYMSSSISPLYTNHWVRHFGNGGEYYDEKDLTYYRVRAIRTF